VACGNLTLSFWSSKLVNQGYINIWNDDNNHAFSIEKDLFVDVSFK
jgi:hypothetical protein